jgi:methionyl-tRNA formyltransferase
MHPWPCATIALGGDVVKLHRVAVLDAHGTPGAAPGAVLGHSRAGVDVACGAGAVRLLELQMPGRTRLDAASFFAGQRLAAGTLLG